MDKERLRVKVDEVKDVKTVYLIDVSLPEWLEMCLKNLGNYNEVKPAFQLVGVIVGLFVAVTAVKRLFH